jgi:hypothetical protein
MTTPANSGGPRRDPRHAVEDLARANAESNHTLMRLVQKVSDDATMRERKVDLLERSMRQGHRLLILLTVVLIALLMVGAVNAANIASARRNAEVTAQSARDSANTYALLLDCLNSRGECGKRNAQQTKSYLDEVKVYELVLASCDRAHPVTDDADSKQFIDCVKRHFPNGPVLPDSPIGG